MDSQSTTFTLRIDATERLYRCPGCGKVLGSIGDGFMVIKHKGRKIQIFPEGKCTVRITCDSQLCQKSGEIELEGLTNRE